MDHIIIKPTKVRGQGNVLSPKTNEDYNKYNCIVESATDENIQRELFNLTPLFFILTFDSELYAGVSSEFHARVYYNAVGTDDRLTGKTLELYQDGVLIATSTIDNQGRWINTRNITLTQGNHIFQLKFEDVVSQKWEVMVKSEVGSISLTSDKSEVYVGENITWTATVRTISGEPYVGETVTFSSIDQTAVTDENGIATITYAYNGNVTSYGYLTKSVVARLGGKMSNTVNGVYWNHNPQSLELSAESTITKYYVGQSGTIGVNLLDHFNNHVTWDVCLSGLDNSEYTINQEVNSPHFDAEVNYVFNSSGNRTFRIYACGYQYRVYEDISVNVIQPELSITSPSWYPYQDTISVTIEGTDPTTGEQTPGLYPVTLEVSGGSISGLYRQLDLSGQAQINITLYSKNNVSFTASYYEDETSQTIIIGCQSITAIGSNYVDLDAN